jgi:hypothetical protein
MTGRTHESEPVISLAAVLHEGNGDGTDMRAVLERAGVAVIIDRDGSVSRKWGVGIWPFLIGVDASGVVQSKRSHAHPLDFHKLADELIRVGE